MNSHPRFMNATAVPQAYGISRRTLARREKTDPQFPKGRRLSARLVVFCVRELDSYFSNKQSGGSTDVDALERAGKDVVTVDGGEQ